MSDKAAPRELMRRYWQPVALVSEIPSDSRAPLPVTLLVYVETARTNWLGFLGAAAFAPAMLAEARWRSFTFRTADTRVEKAELGDDAGLFGAAYLPWTHLP